MRPPSSVQRIPEYLQDPLRRCARGELPPNVALMQMAMACRDRDEMEQSLALAIAAFAKEGDLLASNRLGAARRLWDETPKAWETIRAVLAAVGQSNGGEVADWSRCFDRAAEISPEASVALYSLGRADLLESATAEVVAYMRRHGLLRPGHTALEIGCGIGRFLVPLAGEFRFVVGLDISLEMLREARRRCAGLDSIALLRGSGKGLECLASASFDLVFAIDSFPYIVASGEAAVVRHIQEVSRVLRPGGTCFIVNYSYRGDRATHRAALTAYANSAALRLLSRSADALCNWDGEIFHLVHASAVGLTKA